MKDRAMGRTLSLRFLFSFASFVSFVSFVSSVSFVSASGSQVADAVMTGDQAALRTLLQQQADVNAPQVDGATALHWAVYRDDLDTVDLLLRAGAKADAANREGVT